MDEANLRRFHKKVPKQRTEQKLNERKTNTRIALKVKVSSLRRGGIGIGVFLGWLSTGIVFHIDVLKAGLKERAGSSSKVKLNRDKVNL